MTTAPAALARRAASQPIVPAIPQQFKSTLTRRDTDVVSETPSSLFDTDDIVSEPDSTTDVSGSSFMSEADLPPELDPDERLLNPKKYFNELEELESDVAWNSGLFLMSRRTRRRYPIGKFDLLYEYHSPGLDDFNVQHPNYDSEVLRFCRNIEGASTKSCSIKDINDPIRRLTSNGE